MSGSVADAYSAIGAAWLAGPARIYDRLAAELVDRCPGGVAGRRVLDVGAGTGAASRAATAAGASTVIAVDVAIGMLRVDLGRRPPAAAGDALCLPFRPGAFDAVIAAFSLNHLQDPATGLREAARVLEKGGGLVVSAYAEDDAHPVKAAVEAACTARGWRLEPWYEKVKQQAVPRLATVERASSAAELAGLAGATVTGARVPFPDLSPTDLVEWRLGMVQMAPFLAALRPEQRAAVVADARAALGPHPPVLERSIIVLTWQRR